MKHVGCTAEDEISRQTRQDPTLGLTCTLASGVDDTRDDACCPYLHHLHIIITAAQQAPDSIDDIEHDVTDCHRELAQSSVNAPDISFLEPSAPPRRQPRCV